MTTPLTLTWVSDEDGTFVVKVDGATAASGSCVANVAVVNVINEDEFFVGDNAVTVTVTNANGVGTDIVNVARLSGPTNPGLCWSSPTLDMLPRTELDAFPLANRASMHFAQPRQSLNVFILRSGAIVNDWVTPSDPIRVSLFGAGEGQHVTAADALLLTAAGYGPNLVQCPSASGWDNSGWDTTPWDS